MDKELVTGGDQEDSDSDEERIIPADEKSGSETESEQSQMEEDEIVTGDDEEDTDSDGGDVRTSEEDIGSEAVSIWRK